MNEIRVLHIVGNSRYGGGAVVILPLAQRARREGWCVDILTTDPVFQQKIREADPSIGVVALDVLWREIRPLRDLTGLVRLTRYLRAHPYTIVHTHTSKAGVVGRIAARLAGVPVVVHTVHGFAFHEASGRAAQFVYGGIERLAAHFCDALVTVSHFHRDWALALKIGTPQKVIAIPNGLDSDRVRVTKAREEIRAELGLRQGEYAIFSAGRLAKQKGFEYLLRSVLDLKDCMDRPFRVLIAGQGELREPLQHLCSELGLEEYVEFLGFRHDLGDLLQAADLVVMPSLWEGLSISLLEAMAAGKPIVTTRIGSNLEVVEHEKTALLVDPANVDQLTDAILRCDGDEPFAASLGRNAQARFRSEYTYERMLQSYIGVYKQLIEAKHAAELHPVHA